MNRVARTESEEDVGPRLRDQWLRHLIHLCTHCWLVPCQFYFLTA